MLSVLLTDGSNLQANKQQASTITTAQRRGSQYSYPYQNNCTHLSTRLHFVLGCVVCTVPDLSFECRVDTLAATIRILVFVCFL
jgi:hypothetical protein